MQAHQLHACMSSSIPFSGRHLPRPAFSAGRGRKRGTERNSVNSVLEWASGSQKHVAIQDLPPPKGRGLVALQDIAAQEIILSVPFDKVYSSKGFPGQVYEQLLALSLQLQLTHAQPEAALELHWSVDMAMRLLKDKQRCQEAKDSKEEDGLEDGSWCEWLCTLPSHVLTPLEFSEEEVSAISDEGLQNEVLMMQGCMEASYEVLQEDLEGMGCSFHDFLAAVQVLHSRCFLQPDTGCHLAVPGIDMANHSPNANAAVAVQQSPEAVQGLAAIEEVCDPSTLATCAPSSFVRQELLLMQHVCPSTLAATHEPSRFNLVASTKISKGEEVTICYGAQWPDAAFLLLFGFLPEGANPANLCVLFTSLEEFVVSYLSLRQQQRPETAPAFEELLLKISTAVGDICQGLFVTAEGMDGRLPPVFQVLEECYSDHASSLSLQALLQARVQGKLQELQALTSQEVEGELSQGRAVARAFRSRQAQLLQQFLSCT